jgi:hypothetical protein
MTSPKSPVQNDQSKSLGPDPTIRIALGQIQLLEKPWAKSKLLEKPWPKSKIIRKALV